MKILVLPGDGVGKEVTAQSVKVLNAVIGKEVAPELAEALIGAAGVEMAKDSLPAETLELTRPGNSTSWSPATFSATSCPIAPPC
jgi:3-isopropylmalate dehydrogenase